MRRSAVGSCSDNDDIGKTGLFMILSSSLTSQLNRGDVDPAPLLPALQRAFGKLHALGAFEQLVFIRRVFADVADEHLPLLLKTVVVGDVLRDLLPVAIEIVGPLLVRI